MTKVVLYVATSQDHFIADSSGGVSWLPQTEEETGGEDFGYRAFYDSIDALAIGRKTYEQILTFGDWPLSRQGVLYFYQSSTEVPTPRH